VYIAPYGKYLFEPIRNFYPMIIGRFEFVTFQEEYITTGQKQLTDTRTKSLIGLTVSVGGEWFPYSSVGVSGGVKFLTAELDPSRFIIGIAQPFIGIEWFL
jgi:hypothetical protein